MRALAALFAMSFVACTTLDGGALEDASTPEGAPDAASSDPTARDATTAGEDASASPDAGTTSAPDAAVHDAAIDDAGSLPSGSTAGVACDYSYSGYNASPSVRAMSTASWSCTQTSRVLTANGLPEHEVGTFPNPNCPNTISAYSVAATLTLTPALAAAPTGGHIMGWALNGVKLDPNTAGSCDASGNCSLIGNTGPWNIEALGQTSFDFGVDSNNAHVQPTGEYHYHGMPEGELARFSGGQVQVTLVAFASDGFPIYARYGYDSATDAGSTVRALRGSYRTKSTPDAGRPSTSTYPMGTFLQDWEYVAGLGDLDECNGRFGVTPEFPMGIYHYYITDTYPFIQRCVKGTPSASAGGMGGTGGTGGMGGTPPSCTAGQTSRCCGDGTCGGPETHANCPADCR